MVFSVEVKRWTRGSDMTIARAAVRFGVQLRGGGGGLRGPWAPGSYQPGHARQYRPESRGRAARGAVMERRTDFLLVLLGVAVAVGSEFPC